MTLRPEIANLTYTAGNRAEPAPVQAHEAGEGQGCEEEAREVNPSAGMKDLITVCLFAFASIPI